MRLMILKAGTIQPPAETIQPVAEPAAIADPVEAEISAAHEPEPVEDPPSDPLRDEPDMTDEAARFAKAATPRRLVDPERPHLAHLVGPDLTDPSVWRHTVLIDDQPFEHSDHETADAAFVSALRAGGIPAYDDAGETS